MPRWHIDAQTEGAGRRLQQYGVVGSDMTRDPILTPPDLRASTLIGTASGGLKAERHD